MYILQDVNCCSVLFKIPFSQSQIYHTYLVHFVYKDATDKLK